MKAKTIAKIIWGCSIITKPVYFMLSYVIEPQTESIDPQLIMLPAILGITFAFIAIIINFESVQKIPFIENFIRAGAGEYNSTITFFCIKLGIVETSALMGLIIFIFSGNRTYLIFMLILSIIAWLFNYPKQNENTNE